MRFFFGKFGDVHWSALLGGLLAGGIPDMNRPNLFLGFENASVRVM